MISRILFFLLIIFCINGMVVGLGLSNYSATNLDRSTIVTNAPDEFEVLTYPTTAYVDVGDPDEVIESDVRPEFIPDVTEGYSAFRSIGKITKDLLIGWTNILYLLRLPAIILYTLIGAIGILQGFSMFYLIAYFIGAIRGRI